MARGPHWSDYTEYVAYDLTQDLWDLAEGFVHVIEGGGPLLRQSYSSPAESKEKSRTFLFLQRTEQGRVFAHSVTWPSLLDALRGLSPEVQMKEVVGSREPGEGETSWWESYGIAGAPDGLPLVRIGMYARPFSSGSAKTYGVAMNGRFEPMFGDELMGQYPSFSLWNRPALPVEIREDGTVHIHEPDPKFVMSVDLESITPDVLKKIAKKICRDLEFRRFGREEPSLDYFDISRWHRAEDGTWSFTP